MLWRVSLYRRQSQSQRSHHVQDEDARGSRGKRQSGQKASRRKDEHTSNDGHLPHDSPGSLGKEINLFGALARESASIDPRRDMRHIVDQTRSVEPPAIVFGVL
jgi:hypothetical protein